MKKTLIKNATLVNESSVFSSDILIVNDRIEKIAKSIPFPKSSYDFIDAEGLHLIPGIIDAHVHFREPGLTQKGTIRSESMAAVSGGITSFMDMPNTIPNTLTLELLEKKYDLAQQSSVANFSFFLGINKSNLEAALNINNETVCGISDDGLYFNDSEGLLADYPEFLEKTFSQTNSLVALHCENSALIKSSYSFYNDLLDGDIPVRCHPLIRPEKACFDAANAVVHLAEKFNTRLHVLHVSTEAETNLFRNDVPLREKRITGEACVHHLRFTDEDYGNYGNKIKWNPAIKTKKDKDALLRALLSGRLDTIATDHAPHLWSEKDRDYQSAMPGGPLVQHALPVLLEMYHQGLLSLQDVVAKTSHNVAEIYRIRERGYLREGYYADFVLLDLKAPWVSTHESIRYRCGWSPFEDHRFKSKVIQTFVNGNLVYDHGEVIEHEKGKRLLFEKQR